MITDEKHKVVMIGDPMVGKTSILTRLVKGYYNQNYVPTIGTGCSCWETSNGHDKIQLQIWDTAGQERYRSLGKLFYQNAEAAVLVVSQTIPWEEQNPDMWIKEFREVAGHNAYVIVSANQSDVSTENSTAIAIWAKKNDILYVETSAKNGKGVRDIFECVACEVRRTHERLHGLKDLPRQIVKECKPKVRQCC